MRDSALRADHDADPIADHRVPRHQHALAALQAGPTVAEVVVAVDPADQAALHLHAIARHDAVRPIALNDAVLHETARAADAHPEPLVVRRRHVAHGASGAELERDPDAEACDTAVLDDRRDAGCAHVRDALRPEPVMVCPPRSSVMRSARIGKHPRSSVPGFTMSAVTMYVSPALSSCWHAPTDVTAAAGEGPSVTAATAATARPRSECGASVTLLCQELPPGSGRPRHQPGPSGVGRPYQRLCAAVYPTLRRGRPQGRHRTPSSSHVDTALASQRVLQADRDG